MWYSYEVFVFVRHRAAHPLGCMYDDAPCTAPHHRATYLPTQARLADASVDNALAEAWGAALQTNCTLERLNLESNAVGTRGVRALAAALRVNRSLRELKICNQRVRYIRLDAGYTPAASPLRCNYTP